VNLFFAAIAGPGLFGIISLMIVNAAILVIITDFGTGASVTWHQAGEELRQEKVFSFAVGSAIFQLTLFVILEIICIRTTGKTLLSQQSYSGYFLSNELCYFTGLVLAEKYSALFYGRNKARLANKTLLAVTAIYLVVFILIYAEIIMTIDPFSLFCYMVLSSSVCLAIVFHVDNKSLVLIRSNYNELRSLLNFSVIAFIANIIQFLAYRLDFWLIKYFYNDETLGIYAQANRFAQLSWVIPVILASVLMPVLRSKNNFLGDRTFLQILRLLSMGTLIIVIGLIAISMFFYYRFFPEKYSEGLPALLLMLPGYFLFAMTTLIAAWFSAKRLLMVNLIGSVICFISILVSDLLLIPRYSLNGAGISNTIAYSVTSLYFMIQFQRHSATNFSDLFAWKKDDFVFFKKFISW